MQRCLKNTIAMIGSLVLISIFACKKTHTTPTKVELTPLQTLINTDTTLSLYHLMIVQANDEVLLSDAAATLFFPTNVVLEQAGYTDVIIDSMSSTLADRIVKYNYVPGAINTDSAGYTANPAKCERYRFGPVHPSWKGDGLLFGFPGACGSRFFIGDRPIG
jgi:hypothetical protein